MLDLLADLVQLVQGLGETLLDGLELVALLRPHGQVHDGGDQAEADQRGAQGARDDL